MNTQSFTNGNLTKAMLRFVGPYLLGIIVQNLYGAVDLFVVGHYGTTADVSAVTIGSQIMGMLTQLVIGFATGITVLIARYFGAGKKRQLAQATGSAVVLFGVFALAITVAVVLPHRFIVSLMQTPAQAVGPAQSYLLICAAGLVFIVGYNVISCILMGLGDTRTPFLFISVACIINVVFDILLVRYLHWGAMGAAVATTGAQAGSVLFSLLYLKKRGLGFAFTAKDIKPCKKQTLEMLKIGGPVAVQNALVGASFLFITAIINQMGLVASAAVGVVEKLINFLLMPALAFGAAVATVSAQNIGAGLLPRANKSLARGIVMALVPSAFIVVFCQFAAPALASFFTKDTGVIAIAASYLGSYVFDCVMCSFVFCMNGYFNSRGYAWFTLLHSMLATFIVRVPLSFVFARVMDASFFVIGMAAPLSTLVSLLLCTFFARRIFRRDARAAAVQPQQPAAAMAPQKDTA